MSILAVILAAGEGVRMKSSIPKGMHKLFDKPICQYPADAAKKAGADKIVMVIGHGGEMIEKNIKGAEFVWQKERLGTGHAVMTAKEYFKDEGDILVLYGDTPLVTSDGLSEVIDYHRNENNDVTVVSTNMENPAGYGRIIRKNGVFTEITEDKDLALEDRGIKEINTGIYCFKSKLLKFSLERLTNNNSQGEYYLTDTVKILIENGYKAGAYTSPRSGDYYGINTRVQLSEAGKALKMRINEKHMLNGVTICDPENTCISPDVKIGADTVIYPGTSIEGDTEIGEFCHIGQNCRIKDSRICSHVEINESVILSSEIGEHTKIGPFAYVRPGSQIGRNVKIGDFVEVKNSVIGDNTKASHLTYIGDADIGSNINFGCGTVIVNYDGNKKSRTVVKDDVFIGCNSNLVSPVTIGEGAYIAAGSTITGDVPQNTLGIARARQVNKEGWKLKKDN